ncbi:maltose regulon regulatory protein MalI (repressor for malXY) [Klebsiella grimontii]|uniref:Maltose regulon regulatory protein MalI (Repressor for malXY) n=1 Tax=Klebsiella grimontii TaxID=2058152 RepID=A0A7H4P2R6_9ENTR|nr:maltose regulon regulatory protein MalI (repressor for malXY) [Klebsiella grimontii]
MPLVFASRASYLDDVDLIRPDNMQAAQIVTEHLIRRGPSAHCLAGRAELVPDAAPNGWAATAPPY